MSTAVVRNALTPSFIKAKSQVSRKFLISWETVRNTLGSLGRRTESCRLNWVYSSLISRRTPPGTPPVAKYFYVAPVGSKPSIKI